MTREEVTICKAYLNDLDRTHDCNEYKLLMELLNREPSEDCVSRKRLMDNYNGVETPVGYRKVVDFEVIKNMQPVTPTRKKGKWKKEYFGAMYDTCSECGQRVITGYFEFNYCPNCGAEMESEE